MAVEHLENSGVFTGEADPIFTDAYPPPAGTDNRCVVMVAILGPEFGGAVDLAEGTATATYGGITLELRDVTLDDFDDSFLLVGVALFNDDTVDPAGEWELNISNAWNEVGNVQAAVELYFFDNVAQIVDSSWLDDSVDGLEVSTEQASITLGDLVFSAGSGQLNSGDLPFDATDVAEYTQVAVGDYGSFIIGPSGGYFPRARVAFSANVAGTQELTWMVDSEAPSALGTISFQLAAAEETSFNCECDDETGYENLGQLRNRLMARLGFAAQINNPPPGMAVLLNDFLQSSQRLLYMKYKALRTERFFTWTMEPGVRLYDLPENEETCTKRIQPHKLSWVGVEDLNGTWMPLRKGINPENYTSLAYQSLPELYEIRQCIEVFPVPDQAYKLRIKAHFGLEAFAADEDVTTIDSELVFLWALATAKAHYGQADANNIAAMANTYLLNIVGGTHQTGRYIPGAAPAPALPRPRMTEFDE